MQKIGKKDIILGVSIVFIALILFFAGNVYGRSTGNQVRISVDGQTYGIYSLDENQEIEVEGDWGHNHVIISDGAAYMEEADCPDGYCEQQGKISKENETIVCLPHKLVVEVLQLEEDAKNEIDAIAK